MPDYKAMYFELAAQVANAIELLIKAQQTGEEAYIKNSYEANLEDLYTLRFQDIAKND